MDKRKNFALDLDGGYNRTPGFGLGMELVIEFSTATFPEPGGFELTDKLLKKCPLFRWRLIGDRLVGFCAAGMKVLLCLWFLLLTAPVTAHTLSRGAHRSGVKLCKGSVVDQYAEDKEGEKVKP